MRRLRPPRGGIITALLVSLALVVSTVAGSTYVYANNLLQTFDERKRTVDSGLDQQADAFADGELNILLLGSDARPEEDIDDARSDTMMLVHIPESQDEMYIISIMRDLWVDIPGYGTGKINGALDYGSYPLAIDTVEQVIGIDIDHLAIIDFDGFLELTTALDGVPVNNEIAFSSGQRNPSFFPAGEIKIQGTDALRFVRERKAFLEGDYQRVRNQQIFLAAVVSEILQADTLSSPDKIAKIVQDFSPFITVDEGLDAKTLVGYGVGMRSLRPADIEMFTLPNDGTGTTSGGAAVVWQDEEGVAEMRRAMADGTMKEFVAKLKREEAEEDDSEEASPSPEPSEIP